MKHLGISAASDVFSCSQKASIHWQSVPFQEFQVFTKALQDLIKAVGQLEEDDYWFRFMSRIRRFRFDAIAAPISNEALQLQLRDLIERMKSSSDSFAASHPNARMHYSLLLRLSQNLQSVDLSRLLTSLALELSRHDQRRQTAVLVCSGRLISAAEQGLASIGIQDVDVTSPIYLREDICYGKIIVIGPTRWYPEYVFAAPRAEDLLVVKYVWLRDSWKHKPVFVMPLKQRVSKLMQSEIDDPYDNSYYSADEMLPPAFDFSLIKKKAAEATAGHHEIDYVKARLFLLEEGWAVFLEDEETSKTHVIDLSDLESPVKKIKASTIEPGMYILLRTGGGGDFIVAAADQIMGSEGIKARQLQKNWKKLLREKVISDGSGRVISRLLEFGSIRANPNNLRNWLSARNICTDAKEDFYAIMKLIGLEKERGEYLSSMKIIDSAHIKAGHHINQKLLETVENSDLKTLKRTGKMVFEMEGESSISITAFHVKEIAPDAVQVMPWQIGNPIEQSE